MKIALLRFSTVFGGVEAHLFSLAQHLKSTGHEPILIVRDQYLHNRAQRNGLDVYLIRKKFKLDVLFLSRLWKLLKGICPDIAHSHGALSAFCTSLILPRLSRNGIPHVTTVHSLPWIGFGYGRLKSLVYKKMYSFSLKRASAVITVSKWLEKRIPKENEEEREKIRVIHNGIDWRKYEPCYTARLKNFRKKNDKLLVGYAGRLTEEKGIRFFIHALALIVKKRMVPSNIEGIILGDGKEKGALEKLIIASDLSGKIKLPGFKENVSEILAPLDLFVLPSIVEGLPMILLEVGAMGIPIVATDVGGVPELIRNGIEGILVPPSDPESLAKAISILAQSPLLRRDLAKNLRLKVREEFSLEITMKEILKTYEAVLQ